MVQKYIIDKTDIHDLLTGKEIPLPQGRARAFCVEIAGKITNGDMIKAMFPYIKVEDKCSMYYSVNIENLSSDKGLNTVGFRKDWWNAPYKTESEEIWDS